MFKSKMHLFCLQTHSYFVNDPAPWPSHSLIPETWRSSWIFPSLFPPEMILNSLDSFSVPPFPSHELCLRPAISLISLNLPCHPFYMTAHDNFLLKTCRWLSISFWVKHVQASENQVTSMMQLHGTFPISLLPLLFWESKQVLYTLQDSVRFPNASCFLWWLSSCLECISFCPNTTCHT